MVERGNVHVTINDSRDFILEPEDESSSFTLRPGETKILFDRATPTIPLLAEDRIRKPSARETWISAGQNSATVMQHTPQKSDARMLIYQRPDLTPSLPFTNQSKLWWSINFGENPNTPSVLKLGDPAVLEIEFAGHPDQLILSLINEQKETPNPFVAVTFLDQQEGNKSPIHRSVALPSRVFTGTFLLRKYQEPEKTSSIISYDGTGMFFVEISTQWIRKKEKSRRSSNNIRLGLAIIGPDQKLRIYHTESICFHSLPKLSKKDRHDEMTRISEATTLALASLSTEDQQTISVDEFRKIDVLNLPKPPDYIYSLEQVELLQKLLTKNPFTRK